MDIIGSVGTAINLVLKAKELSDKLKNLEIKGLIVELQSQLLDLKEQILVLRDENISLKAEAKKLELPPELTVKDGAYYKADSDGPFCIGCQDGSHKLNRLVERSGLFGKISK